MLQIRCYSTVQPLRAFCWLDSFDEMLCLESNVSWKPFTTTLLRQSWKFHHEPLIVPKTQLDATICLWERKACEKKISNIIQISLLHKGHNKQLNAVLLKQISLPVHLALNERISFVQPHQVDSLASILWPFPFVQPTMKCKHRGPPKHHSAEHSWKVALCAFPLPNFSQTSALKKTLFLSNWWAFAVTFDTMNTLEIACESFLLCSFRAQLLRWPQ